MLVELDILVRKMSFFFEKGLKKKFILHDGLKFYFEEEDRSFISFLITNDEYERETCEAIESILKPGDTFVDLGANIGFYTLIASRIVGENGKVFSFEPTPSTFQTLKKNIKENNFSNIVIAEDNAVSNVSGVAHFKVTEGSEMNSVTNSNDESTISVKKISLDKYFSNIDHNKIDLIKMDIEGQEYNALLGMKKINLNNKSLKIIFEFHRQALKNNNQSGEEIFNLLSSYGFKIFYGFRKRRV